jgi:hypothetical protein
MRNQAIAFLSLFVSCTVAQDAGQLVGRWRSVETSKGGIGAMYDFNADGTVNFSPGAIVPSQYHVEGDRLTFYPSDGMYFTLSWTDDDHLRMAMKGAGSEDYTRLGVRQSRQGDRSQEKLQGEWTGSRDMDGTKVLVHWVFGPDLNGLMMIRFLTQVGTYTVQNGRLVASFAGKPGLDGTITNANGVLSINRSGGRITKLMRY